MKFSEKQLDVFESIVDKHENQLEIANYVTPDAFVISDGEETILVSQGDDQNEMLVEADGYTNVVSTTADDRVTAMEVGLKRLVREYNGDALEETGLDL